MTLTRKEEIRQAAITTIELLKGHTPEQRQKWDNATYAVEELANCILELTAPESAGNEGMYNPLYPDGSPTWIKPAPVGESQEELLDLVYEHIREARSRKELLKLLTFTRKERGRAEGDSGKVSPDLDKFHDLERNDGSFEVDAGDNGIRYRPEPPTP